MANIWEITSDDVERLSSDRFRLMMNRLLRAEGRRHQQLPRVRTSDKDDIADEGVDGLIDGWAGGGDRIPPGDSVWQFKGGKNAPDQRGVKAEMKKPGPRRVLEAGGTYVLVIGIDLGHRRFTSREKWLQEGLDELSNGKGPTGSVVLLDAVKVAEWASDQPEMLFDFDKPVEGYKVAERWLKRQPEHAPEYQNIADREEIERALLEVISHDGP